MENNYRDIVAEDAELTFEELQKVRGAYEAFDPDEEAQERMWGAIAAQLEANAEDSKQAGQPQIKVAKPLWKRVVPVAASVALVAVLAGVASTSILGNAGTINENTPAKVDAAGATAETEAYMVADAAYETADAGAGMSLYDDLPEGFNTEEYAFIDEMGFTSVRANPLSTVSADVDTASYANIRRMIRDGAGIGDIPAGAVRIEEMLNYFEYDYATPNGSDLLAQTVQLAECPWNPDTLLLVMGFATAPESHLADNGSNLVFLIDVSGSMDSPDKLGLLQDSFATLMNGLDENDVVSIVTYSGEERVVAQGLRGNDKEAILRAIYSLRAGGYTNGEAGLKKAYEIAQQNFIEGGVNRIILASDGDLNVGMSSTSDLHDYVEKQRETGIYLSVLGFGSGNYKDTKMEVLADYGNGAYHYIDCLEEAERVFERNLTANLVPLADDVKIQVEFNPALVKAYRLIGYENRTLADEDFRNDAANAGDIGPNAQFTVAYEIVLADSPFEVYEPDLKYGEVEASTSASADELLTCTIRYKRAGENAISEQDFAVNRYEVSENPSDDWTFAASVIEAGMVMRDSTHKGSATLESARALAVQAGTDESRAEFAELLERLSLRSDF